MGVTEAQDRRWEVTSGSKQSAESAGQVPTGHASGKAGNISRGHIMKGLKCLAGEQVLASTGNAMYGLDGGVNF